MSNHNDFKFYWNLHSGLRFPLVIILTESAMRSMAEVENKALMSDSIIDQYSYQINFNNLVLFSQIFAMIMNRSKQLLQLLKEA